MSTTLEPIQSVTFLDLGLSDRTCATLARYDISTPTPIQESSIPVAMEGGDVIGIAQTGTGKTLAFALPMIERLKPGEVGLVLAPTRELAQQIQETYTRLKVQSALIVGGASMNLQIRDLKRKPEVIVATPGRLEDHMAQKTLRLDRVSIVVLDEADRMLDMGFEQPIRRILGSIPTPHQTLLYSATMAPEVTALANQFLTKPTRIEIQSDQSTPRLIDQELVFLTHQDKHDVLYDILREEEGTVLVFARTRHGARKLSDAIRKIGHSSTDIHSDKSLAQRREALHGFKSGRYRVLVATDVAARGIDVKDISLVINFDLPENPEDYLHRIGRTGRAGAFGKAIAFVIPEQSKMMRSIEKLMGFSPEVSLYSTVRPGNAYLSNEAPKPRHRKR